MKSVVVVGVRQITRVTVECPQCLGIIEWPYESFVEIYGEPFTGDHVGQEITCSRCGEPMRFHEFYVED